MEQVKERVEKVLEPKQLAARMGISPKRLRSILRAEHPREAEVKGKRWDIPMVLAKEVEKGYKEKKTKREKTQKAKIEKELKGEE